LRLTAALIPLKQQLHLRRDCDSAVPCDFTQFLYSTHGGRIAVVLQLRRSCNHCINAVSECCRYIADRTVWDCFGFIRIKSSSVHKHRSWYLSVYYEASASSSWVSSSSFELLDALLDEIFLLLRRVPVLDDHRVPVGLHDVCSRMLTSCLNVLTEIRTMYWNRIYQLNVNVNLRPRVMRGRLLTKPPNSAREIILCECYINIG